MTGMVKHSTCTHTRTEYVKAEYEYECDYLYFQWSEYEYWSQVLDYCKYESQLLRPHSW